MSLLPIIAELEYRDLCPHDGALSLVLKLYSC